MRSEREKILSSYAGRFNLPLEDVVEAAVGIPIRRFQTHLVPALQRIATWSSIEDRYELESTGVIPRSFGGRYDD